MAEEKGIAAAFGSLFGFLFSEMPRSAVESRNLREHFRGYFPDVTTVSSRIYL